MSARYCSNCGAALSPDARACARCGTPLKGGKGFLIIVIGLLLVLMVALAVVFLRGAASGDEATNETRPAPEEMTSPAPTLNEQVPLPEPSPTPVAPNAAAASTEKLFNQKHCAYGTTLDAAFEQLSADVRRRQAELDKLPESQKSEALERAEGASTYRRVPATSFHGLTVVAIGNHYEATSIYFRESSAAAIQALKAAGYPITDKGDFAEPADDDVVTSASVSATTADDRDYGASELVCGV